MYIKYDDDMTADHCCLAAAHAGALHLHVAAHWSPRQQWHDVIACSYAYHVFKVHLHGHLTQLTNSMIPVCLYIVSVTVWH